jgi:hypothetical protein
MKVCIAIVVIRKEEEDETVCSNPYGKAVKEATASREQEQYNDSIKRARTIHGIKLQCQGLTLTHRTQRRGCDLAFNMCHATRGLQHGKGIGSATKAKKEITMGKNRKETSVLGPKCHHKKPSSKNSHALRRTRTKEDAEFATTNQKTVQSSQIEGTRAPSSGQQREVGS